MFDNRGPHSDAFLLDLTSVDYNDMIESNKTRTMTAKITLDAEKDQSPGTGPVPQPTFTSAPIYQPPTKANKRDPYSMCQQYEDPVIFKECIKFYVDQNKQIDSGKTPTAPPSKPSAPAPPSKPTAPAPSAQSKPSAPPAKPSTPDVKPPQPAAKPAPKPTPPQGSPKPPAS